MHFVTSSTACAKRSAPRRSSRTDGPPSCMGLDAAATVHTRKNVPWLPGLVEALAAGIIDVAITYGLIPEPPGIATEVFCAEVLLARLGASHRLAAQDEIANRLGGGVTLVVTRGLVPRRPGMVPRRPWPKEATSTPPRRPCPPSGSGSRDSSGLRPC